MSREKHYPQIMIDFVVMHRANGTAWLKIQDLIQTSFKTNPPSIRQMRNWIRKQNEVYTITSGQMPDRVSELFKSGAANYLITHSSHKLGNSAYQNLLASPVSSVEYKTLLLDPMDNLGMEMFALIERAVGQEKFEELLKRFRLLREQNKNGQPGPPQGSSEA